MIGKPIEKLVGIHETRPQPEAAPTNSWEDVSLGQRLMQPRTILSFIVAAVVIAFAVSRLDLEPRAILQEIGRANPLYLAIAAASYYGSFGLRAARWRSLLHSADVQPAPGRSLPTMGGLVTIFILSWFANCLVPAKLGDAYRGFLLKRRSGTSFSGALGTIFAERLADLVTLAVVLVTSGLLVFGTHVPEGVGTGMIASVVIGVFLIIGLLSAFRFRSHLRTLIPERMRGHYIRLEEGALGSFGRVPTLLGFTATIWLFEGVRLYFVGLSVGAHLTIASALFIALFASLLTAVPVTPAGLGFVELGIVGTLALLGVADQTAASIAVLDRLIAYWSVIVVGMFVYLGVRWAWRT